MAVSILFKNFFYHLFLYREYFKQAVARELRKRYKRSILGYCWSLLHPLMMMTILSIVFSHVMRFGTENYPVFLFAGMIPWAFFNNSSIRCLRSIRDNASIIDQIAIPKYIFPVSLVLSKFVDMLLALLPLFLVMLFLDHPITPTVFALPIVLLPLIIMTLGVSLIFSVMSVFFLDTHHLLTVAFQGLYFLSPVLFGRMHLPEWLVQHLEVWNPMWNIIEYFRGIFYFGTLPDPTRYAYSLLTATVFLLIGLWTYKKADSKFMYFI